MRRTGLVCLVVMALGFVVVSAQESAAPLPKDPLQLLLLAKMQNRLSHSDIGPWHLKVSVKQFDPSGAITGESQIEEFWDTESKHKVIYTTPTGAVTEYTIGAGLTQSEGAAWPPPDLQQTGNAFTDPIFESEAVINTWILSRKNRNQDGAIQVCVEQEGIKIGSDRREFKGPMFCVDLTQPSLLSLTNPIRPGFDAVYTRSDIQNFRGYFVPREVVLTVGGKRKVEAHLDLLESLPKVDDAMFSPPPGAILAPRIRSVPGGGGIVAGELLRGDEPVYPAGAKMMGITGTVVIAAKIAKDGSVTDLRVVSGPVELQQAAMDAVKTWRYKPYLLNGKPVDTMTTLRIHFAPHR